MDYEDKLVKLYCGDCVEKMKEFEENSFDAIVTDPPYLIFFMSKIWDKVSSPAEMQLWHYTWAVEALRVIKPGGYLLSFSGTRTFHRLACALEDAGFEFRDTIMWVYSQGFPKNLNISKAIDRISGIERIGKGNAGLGKGHPAHDGGYKAEYNITIPKTLEAKEWEGWGTSLKPAWEPILIFRKPLIGTVAENVLKYGTGAINIEECRVPATDADNKDIGRVINRNVRQPEDGWGMNDNKVDRPMVLKSEGRWPANVMHDGSEEVMELFPEQKSGAMLEPYEYTNTGFSLGKPSGKTKQIHSSNSGSAARFFYCSKACKGERDLGLECDEGQFMDEGREVGSPGGTNPRNRGAQTARKNFHPCVKPVELMKWLITLVSRKDSLILDPFVGSGSTLVAAKKSGRKVVGIEKSEEYCKLAIKRLKAPLQKTFF